MARLPRLEVPGSVHLLMQCPRAGLSVLATAQDRDDCVRALQDSIEHQAVDLHGYVVLPDALRLLATPRQAGALGRWMQSLGRRQTLAFRRRHGGQGAIWEGRFRAAPLEAERWELAALLDLESLPVRRRLVDHAWDWSWSSAAHHLGRSPAIFLTDPGTYWLLGNTPFEREAVYRHLLQEGVTADQSQALLQAARGGWALGGAAFIERLGQVNVRRARPRPRGRPAQP